MYFLSLCCFICICMLECAMIQNPRKTIQVRQWLHVSTRVFVYSVAIYAFCICHFIDLIYSWKIKRQLASFRNSFFLSFLVLHACFHTRALLAGVTIRCSLTKRLKKWYIYSRPLTSRSTNKVTRSGLTMCCPPSSRRIFPIRGTFDCKRVSPEFITGFFSHWCFLAH